MEASTSAKELYCSGIFSTLAVVKFSPFLWDSHWRRLSNNATTLGVNLTDHSKEETLKALEAEIDRTGVRNGRARITFSDESPSRIWSNDERERKTSLSIIVAERRPVPENFRLTVSPHRINTTSPLTGIKSCNYLEHLLAHEEASQRGFDEAIRLNDRGEIASACMANVFWETDGKLFTTSLTTGCLPGTTREFVLENLDCDEIETGIEDLESADRIFVTSSGLGIVGVADFGGRPLDTSAHPLLRLLRF